MALLQWNCSVILFPFLSWSPCVMIFSGYITTLTVAIVPLWLRNNSCISLNASGHRIIPEREGKTSPTAGYNCAGLPPSAPDGAGRTSQVPLGAAPAQPVVPCPGGC